MKSITVQLKKDNSYTIYLLNPSERIKKYTLSSNTNIITESACFYNKGNDYL